MKTYVVYCHPNPESLTFAVRERAVAALVADGHLVRVSDLYADGFEPAMSLEERLTHQERQQRPDARRLLRQSPLVRLAGVHLPDLVER